MRELERFKAIASDGTLCGRVRDVFFDDRNWMVRHFVLGLHPAISAQRQVLLEPSRVAAYLDESLVFNIPAAEVAQAPLASSVLPVCKQYAAFALASRGARHFAGGLAGADPHLRSARAVTSYRLTDGGEFAGMLADLIFDPASGEIRYLEVEQVIERKRVRFHILPASVERFTWATQRVILRELQPVALADGSLPLVEAELAAVCA